MLGHDLFDHFRIAKLMQITLLHFLHFLFELLYMFWILG